MGQPAGRGFWPALHLARPASDPIGGQGCSCSIIGLLHEPRLQAAFVVCRGGEALRNLRPVPGFYRAAARDADGRDHSSTHACGDIIC